MCMQSIAERSYQSCAQAKLMFGGDAEHGRARTVGITAMEQRLSGGSAATPLRREVGLVGLTFISLGSIIGSGWLLGALSAARIAGPAALVSWVLAAVIIAVLALIHAELGAAYPTSGGTARFPH